RLQDGPQSVDQLATACSANAEALYRLLRALASIGIFSESAPREFELTSLAEPLRSDVPGSKKALALMSGDEHFLAWSEVIYSVQTGKTSFDKVFGKPIFDYLGDHPDKAQIFDDAMTGIHGRETGAMLDACDFSGIDQLADIGGGNGSNLCALLNKYPAMKGMLFDLPHVVERASERVEAAGVVERCQIVGGDFFEAVPSGADAILMRHIIHDWEDEKALKILRNCHAALPAQGKLLVVECVIPPGNAPFAGKFLDLVMMLIPGGKERTEEEYRELYEASGFDLSRIIPTTTELSIVEGIKRA
ncbi:MAG: methyltransferase, partial [Planctomycetota bacterium]